MKINLIPVSEPGISYGGDVTNEAIKRFRKYLLGVVAVCSEFEYSGERATPRNISIANFTAVITLFREPKTIGQITGFIHLDGININLSGTGGRYGQQFLNCLVENEVEPWLYPAERAIEQIGEYVGNPKWYIKHEMMPLDTVLSLWERFIINVILPQLHTTRIGFFGLDNKTGSWQDSWQVGDI
ncbi:hypothetical protein [Nostoc sp. JL33]|uniref:hypothetical protein n=1 Tax=Nostoc sp. JL33 TaxID=2815396 RepID=UPI0025EA445F|nr:hypothetical protein [Nostoc sp. JL33]MBN3871857.1 hypothetical protein [Nostoc sp. JL33]